MGAKHKVKFASPMCATSYQFFEAGTMGKQECERIPINY